MNSKPTERELTLIEATRKLLESIRESQKMLVDIQTKMSTYLDDAINMLAKLEQGQLH